MSHNNNYINVDLFAMRIHTHTLNRRNFPIFVLLPCSSLSVTLPRRNQINYCFDFWGQLRVESAESLHVLYTRIFDVVLLFIGFFSFLFRGWINWTTTTTRTNSWTTTHGIIFCRLRFIVDTKKIYNHNGKENLKKERTHSRITIITITITAAAKPIEHPLSF